MRWRPLPAFAAIDFLSCLLVVFVAVALTSSPPQVKTYGDYAVVITWPKGQNDVDLYLRDPGGQTSYFEKPQVASMQLEHDDLGTARTGYDHAKQHFIVRNSWGVDWGKRGYCTMPYDYLLDGNLSDDFWTIKLVQ